MSAQTKYGYASGKGIAGGIFDMFHYPVESRYNEENNGVLRFGVGVVRGSVEGSSVKLPASGATAEQFEGVVVNGGTTELDLDGKLRIMNKQNVGVMRRGKIWVMLKTGEAPTYGAPVHLITDGEEAGCFAISGGVELAGRFIGSESNGIAPVELYGFEPTATEG